MPSIGIYSIIKNPINSNELNKNNNPVKIKRHPVANSIFRKCFRIRLIHRMNGTAKNAARRNGMPRPAA